MKARKHGNGSTRPGFTIIDLTATLAAGTLMCAAALPLAAKAGSQNTRAVSRMHLNTLNVVHTMFAADHNDRQFSAIPDDFGLHPSCALYQAQVGCIDPLVLGEDPLGQTWGFYLGCAGNGTGGSCGNIVSYKPIEFTEPTEGAYRYANTPRINEYVSGRFYDPVFFAPDDPSLNDQTRKFIRAGVDFALNDPDAAGSVLGHTTYDMSPAAMFNPIVMGDGQSGNNPLWRNPSTSSNAGGYGYRSPTVSQCAFPSLKTRLMEHAMTSHAPAPCNASYPGCTPYMWNQSIDSENIALFYDGSVQFLSAREAMNADAHSATPLWLRNTPLGANGVGGAVAADAQVRTSAHFLTTYGIRGRDKLE